MRGNLSIRLKGLAMLLVFSLNTVVGFACSMGIDMRFNHPRHTEAGKDDDGDGCCGDRQDKKTGCCNDGVIRFQQLDKNVSPVVGLTGPLMPAILSSGFALPSIEPIGKTPFRGRIRYSHPPPPDIRVLIQSFQI